MFASLLLRASALRLVLGFVLATALVGRAQAREPDQPLLWNAPVALSPQCGFLSDCARFDSIGLHVANSTLLRGNGDRSFAHIQDLVRLSVTLLDVLELGGALGGHFVHDEAGDSHTSTAPARLFARLRLWPWPWVSLKGGLVIAASFERSLVSQRLGAAEPPGLDINTARLVFNRSFRFVEIEGGAGAVWGAVPDGRWVNLELFASVALTLFADPNDPNERLRVFVQALYRQPLARPDGSQGLRDGYALAGAQLQSGSGYRFGLGIGPQLLGSGAGALVMFDFSVSWGLRYRNPLAQWLAGQPRYVPSFFMDLVGFDPVLGPDGCVYTDPDPLHPERPQRKITCIGQPDPHDPKRILLRDGRTLPVGAHLWIRGRSVVSQHGEAQVGELSAAEAVRYHLGRALDKALSTKEEETGQPCVFQADILNGVTDPGMAAVLAGDPMGGAAAMLGTELGRLIKCGDLKALGGSGILPFLGRIPLKKGPMPYRGTLPGQDEAEHLTPAALPGRTALPDKARSHIFYGDLDKRDQAKGWHYEPSADPKKGTYVIEDTRSASDKYGVYEANVMIEGVKKGARSTFFPKDWSEQQVEAAILEAYEKRAPEGKGSKNRYVGVLSNGMAIVMDLDAKGSITTAFPKIKRPEP